jgi:murein L,D-transpeptidase YafK
LSRPGGPLCLFLAWIAALAVAVPQAATAASPAAASPAADSTAAERLARWRLAKSGRLTLPLPGTPDTNQPLSRLAAAGVSLGAPVLIRVFKAESELEVWIKKRSTFVLFATYPVCYWSGTLGPKLREGDRQTPEGFYTLTERELHHGGRWRRSLNIGYPNPFDRVNGRSGSNILIHGGCDSVGCFAMTDAVNAELYDLVSAALRNGTPSVQLHVFPFRMTDANLAAHPPGPWKEFWSDLKLGYDSFERTHLPPNISVCGRRYRVRDNSPFERSADRIELCEQDRNLIPDHLEVAERRAQQAALRVEPPPPPCSVQRASCRKWVALRDRRATSHTVARQSGSKRSAVR